MLTWSTVATRWADGGAAGGDRAEGGGEAVAKARLTSGDPTSLCTNAILERDGGQHTDGLTAGERKELARLRQEVRQLRRERDILAKAAAWFAREAGKIPSGPSGS